MLVFISSLFLLFEHLTYLFKFFFIKAIHNIKNGLFVLFYSLMSILLDLSS